MAPRVAAAQVRQRQALASGVIEVGGKGAQTGHYRAQAAERDQGNGDHVAGAGAHARAPFAAMMLRRA